MLFHGKIRLARAFELATSGDITATTFFLCARKIFLNTLQLLELAEVKTRDKYQLVGRCGIFCGTDCEVYEAAHSGDVEKKNRVTKALERELGIALDPSGLRCEGCQGPEESMWFECRLCRIRQCGKRQGIRVCIECQDYPCRILELWLSKSQSAPKNLPEINELGLERWIEKKCAACGV